MSCQTAAEVHPAARASPASGTVAMASGVGAARRLAPGRRGSAVVAWRRDRWLMTGGVVLAGGDYAAAKLVEALEFSGPVAAIVWLPAGVAIAFLSLGGCGFGRAFWWAICWPTRTPWSRWGPRSGRRSAIWSKFWWRRW